MPKIEKMQAPKPIQVVKPGSVRSRSVDVRTLRDSFLKVCIYGVNGAGKTYLAGLFPKPMLLVSFEPSENGGAITVSKMEGIEFQDMHNSPTADAVTLAEELSEGTALCNLPDQPKYLGKPFKTIVIDSATSYQDLILKEILNLSKIPEMLSWGMVSEEQYRQRSEKCRELLRPFLDLKHYHVVVTAKEKNHNYPKENRRPKIVQGMADDMSLEPFFAADLGGATVGWLHDACGHICQLYQIKEVKKKTIQLADGESMEQEYETGNIVRRLRTMFHPSYASRVRSSTPKNVPVYIQNPTWEKIWDMVQGKRVEGGVYLTPEEGSTSGESNV